MIPEFLKELLDAGVKIHLEHKQIDQISEPVFVFVISGPVEGRTLDLYRELYNNGSFAINWNTIHSFDCLVSYVCNYWDEKQTLLKEWEQLFLAHNLIKEKEYYVKSA